jgi:carbamoyl-phosphate synthase large subunit
MNILINGVGGPTPRSIARTLRQYTDYKDLTIIGTDINPLAYGLYETELYDKTYLVPPARHKDYWQSLEAIIKKHDIDLALVHPEHEVMVWSKRLTETNNLPCAAYLPDYSLCEVLVDKSKMTELLKDTDLVPESFVFNSSISNFDELENTLEYPFWIRATEGSSGLGSLKVHDRAELKNWLNINPNVENFIASTFLPGRNLGVKLLYHNGKILRSATAERVNYIMSKVAPSGITGNTSYGRLLNEPELVDKAIETLEVLFEKLKVEKHGFFTADFKEDKNGKPYITEVNVRMVAFNLSFAAGGANFTKDIVDLLSTPGLVDKNYKMYEFEPNTIFLRDVDAPPKLMKESDLLRS